MRPSLLSILSGILLFFSTAASAQDNVWDLKRCIDYAIENNIQIKLQELNEQLNQYQLAQSKAGVYPSLNGSANYSVNFGRNINPTTYQFVTQQIQTSSFGVTANVTLFSGLRQLNAIKQNQYDLTSAYYQTETTKNSVMLSITSAYLQILMGRESLKSMQEQLNTTNDQYQQTKTLVDAGALPEGDLYNMKAQLANDSLNLTLAQNSLDLSVLALKLMLQLEPSTEMEFTAPPVEVEMFDPPSPEGPEPIYDFALDNQPQILGAEFTVKSAEKSLAMAKGLHAPTLSLFGNVRTNYSSYEAPPFVVRDPFFTQLNHNFNQSVGISLTVPIFNGLATYTSVRTAKLQILQSQYQGQQVKDQLKQDIYSAYTDAMAALQKYNATLKNKEALETNFQYVEKRYNLGAATALEYSTARNNLTIAGINLINAKFDYIFKLKVLDFYQGKPIVLN